MDNLITHFDPNLKGLEYYSMASLIVYKVEKEGKPYILKIADLRSEKEVHHLSAEKQGLMLAHDIRGINHLMQDYGTKNGYSAILKEYFDGDILCDLKMRFDDKTLLGKLELTINSLHERGIAGLDIDPLNIAASSDKKDVRIIEIGTCVVSKWTDPALLEQIKKKDWHDLREKVIYNYFF